MKKYGNALKMVQPARRNNQNDANILPNNHVGCLSFITIHWMTRIMWKASRHGLTTDDISDIDGPDGVDVNYERLKRLWYQELQRCGPEKISLHKVIWRFNRCRFVMAAIMMILFFVFIYVAPAWLLKYLLDFLDDPEQPLWNGIAAAAYLSLISLLRNLVCNCYWIIGVTAGVRLQGALQAFIYEKVLSAKGSDVRSLGEILNYLSSDAERIFQSMQASIFAIGTPIMWLMNIIYCYFVMGPWSILGNVILLFYYPIMAFTAKLNTGFRDKAVVVTDKRIGLINQVLCNIKLIKMYAWEETFLQKLKEIRRDEQEILQKTLFLQSLSWSLSPTIPVIAPMASIVGYVWCGQNLNSSQAFSILSAYCALLLPLNTLPVAVKGFSEGMVGCQRIQKLLLAADLDTPRNPPMNNANHAIILKNYQVAWYETLDVQTKPKRNGDSGKNKTHSEVHTSKSDLCANASLESVRTLPEVDGPFNIILDDINVLIEKGKLVGVCGPVGSGKTTLLSAICGNVNVLRGQLNVWGSIALVPQHAWIFNNTIKENILFGLPFEEEKYKRIVNACCLEPDFSLMSDGDETQIGERGVNLSGGQKHRISLARAMYSDRDIYLLDDILSAVDVKVAKYIFRNCIQNTLRGKTIIMVTHAVQYLEYCDYILLMKDGGIIEEGEPRDLLSKGGEYAEMVLTAKDDQQHAEGQTKQRDVFRKQDTFNEEVSGSGLLIKEEVDQHSSITFKTMWYFCKKCNQWIAALFFLTIILVDVALVFNSVWLQVWIDAGSGAYNSSENAEYTTNTSNLINWANATTAMKNKQKDSNITLNPDLHMYLIIYAVSTLLIFLFGLLKAFAVGRFMLTGATALHERMFQKVIRSPMSFFDKTPIGRIINRFSKDMDEIDAQIPCQIDFVLQTIVLICMQLLLIGVLYPWYILGLLLILGAFAIFDSVFSSGVKEIKRIENLLRPPLLIHMSTTVQGLDIIKTYDKQTAFSEKFRHIIDKHIAGCLLFELSSKWLAFRADMIGWFAVTATAFMLVAARGTSTTAAAGLAMVQIFRICIVLYVIMRFKSELGARLISIERVLDYCKTLVEEEPIVLPENRPPPEWPNKGHIIFKDVKLRYQPELPLTLNGLSFDISSGQKVGIIGRTGAGKSSIIGAILRLAEICGGTITIDGIDISKISLNDLRSPIAVIPQEPVVFTGKIRWNLDPFDQFSDDELWDALDKIHLKKKISKEPHKLDTVINADSATFSLGEKQLLCLARTLLKKSKILLLDEATASVDVETDRLVQKAIRSDFRDCTVLAIAHRLNTVSDYDKIMTIDAGRVVEFDTPKNLMARDSLFRSLMDSISRN